VPDSLKKAFQTKHGRTVYDGGGITPDIEIKPETYSRPALALSLSGILEEYAVDFYTRNPDFPDGVFKMTDAQWEDFVKYAATKKFDHRSASEIVFEQLVREAKEEGLYEQNKEAYDLLESKVKLTKEEAINQNREEIQPLVEEDIIQKYQLTAPRIRHMLDYDSQLWKAVSSWR
jgi:carboxyl-terminal processing protease